MKILTKPLEIAQAMPLDQIADIVHANARSKGFHDGPDSEFLANQVNNLHSEVSELWDAYRQGMLHALCDKGAKMIEMGLPPLTCIEEEYADIVIRVLDQCRRQNVDIVRAIMVKHHYNQSRPHMHGGRKN